VITLFCPSFSSLIFTLHNYKLGEFDVITHNPAIQSFCNNVAIPVILREEQKDLSIKGYIRHRNYCKKMIAGFKKKKILFCFYSYDFWSLYQLFLLKKKCCVYFYNMDYLASPGYNEKDSIKIPVATNLFKHWKNKAFKNRFFLKWIVFFVTGKLFSIFKYDSNNYALGISPEKCRRIFIPFLKNLDYNLFYENKQVVLQKFSSDKIEVLFIDSGEIVVKYPESLLTFLKNYSTQNKVAFYFKPHPTFSPRFNFENFQLVEKIFPAELLVGIPKVIIGIASTVLVYFSQTTPVISLFNLVEIENGDYKTISRDLIRGLTIDCPVSIDELSSLLNKYLNNKIIDANHKI